MTLKRRLIHWLLSLLGEPLRYPTIFACVIDGERVADVTTNQLRARAACLEQFALGNNVKLVAYEARKAERVRAK